MHPATRVLLVGVVVLALLGLGVVADATAEQRWPYPTQEQIVTDYEAHVGQDALLFASVEGVAGSEARVRVETGSGAIGLTVQNFEASVQPGGVVQVFGRLGPDRVVSAETVAVVNPASGSLVYKYATSLIGVVLFLVAFFRYWRVNVRELRLEPRADG